MDHTGWWFLCGCAAYSDLLFAAREREDLAADDVTASTFYMWDEQADDPGLRWGIFDEVVNWRAQSMATIKPGSGRRVTVAIGTRGQYFEVEPETGAEHVGLIEGVSVPLRRLAAIDNVVVAAGMGRSMLLRESRDRWVQVGPGTTEADANRIVGFEGVDGRSLDNFYAVGWAGEIWRRIEGAWNQIDSPTNANLNAVACAPDGAVYVVGDDGSMVVGRDDRWEFVNTGRPENLQDVAEFDGEIFIVTDFRILRLSEGALVPEQRFTDDDVPSTCLHLLRAQDGIISIGPKDVFRFSGETWERII